MSSEYLLLHISKHILHKSVYSNCFRKSEDLLACETINLPVQCGVREALYLECDQTEVKVKLSLCFN